MKRFTLISALALASLTLAACGQTSTGAVAATDPAESVKVAPDACIEALDAADELTEYMGEALRSASDSMDYATSYDWDSLDAETAKLEELTPKVIDARTTFDNSSALCRASAN